MRFRTRAVHAGSERDEATGAVIPPVHLATTYVQPDPTRPGPCDYARTGNPTRSALEAAVASLESGTHALAYASGMAAIHGIMMQLQPGDRVVAGRDIYGGTYRLLHHILQPFGIDVELVDTTQGEALARALERPTRLVWVESPGNPLMSITDLPEVIRLAHAAEAEIAVDNTFATPALTRPLEWGADYVMHSATKYLGGHSNVLGGVVVVGDTQRYERLKYLQNATGAVLGPWDCYLVQRGLKTLDLRVRAQAASAARIAQWLAEQERVTRVYYPGLASHPGHRTAARQMSGCFGSMLSFEVEGGLDAAVALARSTRLFQLAVSLGAVESLIEIPATMSHASYAAEARRAHGIGDALIRLSVGLEDADDLIDDLARGLESRP